MKLLDDLVHRHAVQVRRDKMQDEPISKLLHVSQPVAQDALDLAGLDRSSGVGFDEVYLNRRRTDDGQLVDETDCRDESQSDEPEPEKDVNLFVDDVERENAQAVDVLNRARGSVLVKGALGQLREDPGHRVHPVVLIFPREPQDFQTVILEFVIQEEVGEEDLDDDVAKGQDLTEEEFQRVAGVSPGIELPVSDEI